MNAPRLSKAQREAAGRLLECGPQMVARHTARALVCRGIVEWSGGRGRLARYELTDAGRDLARKLAESA